MRRALLWFVLGMIVLVAVAAVAVRDRRDATMGPPTTPPPTRPPGAGWTVVHVSDGDTFDATGHGGRRTIRIAGINAPEQGECGADQARQALGQLLGNAPVTLVRDRSDRDGFGRLVRYADRADGIDVGAEMVREGWAVSRRFWPDLARNDAYDALEREAREAGRGEWSPTGCGAPMPGVAVSVTINADPPGPDDEHLAEEWVRFRNDGATPLDLTGWTVADESSSNRYTFAALVLAPGATVILFTGCGTDTGDARYWCSDGFPIWNNDGDTVFLRDPSGTDVVAQGY